MIHRQRANVVRSMLCAIAVVFISGCVREPEAAHGASRHRSPSMTDGTMMDADWSEGAGYLQYWPP